MNYNNQINHDLKESRFIKQQQWYSLSNWYCLEETIWYFNKITTPPFRSKGDPMTHWIIYIKAGIRSLRSGRIWNLFKTRFKQVDNPFGGYVQRQGTLNSDLSYWKGQKL